MRRILSLTLVAIMLLSTLALTSCDAITGFFSGLFGKEVRTQITEVEWQKTLLLDNYTISVKDKYQSMDMMVAKNLIKAVMSYSTPKLSVSVIVDTKNKIVYGESSIGWLSAQMVSEDALDIGLSLAEAFEGLEYKDFKYEEATKSYTVKNETTIFDLHFENGVLVYAMMMPITNDSSTQKAEITNIGKTVVELPTNCTNVTDGKVEPSNAAATVRTQITENEWNALASCNNFTIKAAGFMGSMVAIDMEIKQTENAYSMAQSYGGQVMDEMVYAIIDGYRYNLRTDDEGNIIAEKTSQEADSALSNIVGNVVFEDLVYNEAGRYYAAGDYGYFYFEDGKLVKLVVVEGGMEITALVTDVGTTKIDLPEYTVFVDTEVDEWQWNNNMNATNYTVVGETYDGVTLEVRRNGDILISEMIVDDENTTVYYYVQQDGVMYVVELVDGVWVGKATDREGTLGEMGFGGLAIEYSDFTYDSELGIYVCSGGRDRFEARFENNMLVSITYYYTDYEGTQTKLFTYEVYNIYSTGAIEAPEFTIIEETEEPRE